MAIPDDNRRIEISRELTDCEIELDRVDRDLAKIHSKYTKEIWMDPKFDKEKLRMAELTLRLEDDPDYIAKMNKKEELIRKLSKLEEERDIIRDKIGLEELKQYGPTFKRD